MSANRTALRCKWAAATGLLASLMLAACGGGSDDNSAAATERAQALSQRSVDGSRLDSALGAELQRHGFSGRIASTLELRLGRTIDAQLADLGRKLFFDTIVGLHDDNACAGCHSPAAGMGDTQSIAIGIQSNRIVGPARSGPRNQRRSPAVVNTAFFPKLMWNGRFGSTAGAR